MALENNVIVRFIARALKNKSHIVLNGVGTEGGICIDEMGGAAAGIGIMVFGMTALLEIC